MMKKAAKKAIKAVKKVKTWHQSRKFKKSSFRPAFRKTHKEIEKIFKGIKIVKLPKQATVHAKAVSLKVAMNGKSALTAAGVRRIVKDELQAHRTGKSLKKVKKAEEKAALKKTKKAAKRVAKKMQ